MMFSCRDIAYIRNLQVERITCDAGAPENEHVLEIRYPQCRGCMHAVKTTRSYCICLKVSEVNRVNIECSCLSV